MKAKNTSIFLWTSLSFFVLSLIVFFVKIALLYYEFQTTSSTSTLSPFDFIEFEDNFVIELFAYIMFGIPALLLELSFIRSVYKILKRSPKGCARICYLLSAILSFSALVFQCLIHVELIAIVFYDGRNITAEILLCTQLPIFIVSFILGSIPIKHDDKQCHKELTTDIQK